MSELFTLSVGDHPLIAAWLGLFFVLVVFLGVLHVCRIFGRCLIVVIREVKHELSGLWDVIRDLAKEFSRWKTTRDRYLQSRE